MVVADLHVHTTNSDGELTLDAVPDAAADAALEAVAVTDHDRLHPDLAAPVVQRDGLTLVHGIELRVEAACGRVDLLGYGARRTPALTDEVERIQRDRVERGAAIIDCLEDRLGVALDVEPREGLGRPHVARAVVEATDYGYQETFDELIGEGRPCYRARDVPGFDRGVEVLDEACGLVGLAHPFRYDDPEAALALCADLDALERYYPYDRDVDTALLDRAIERHDLVATGGSDAHDDRLGLAGLSRAEFEAVRGRLDAPG